MTRKEKQIATMNSLGVVYDPKDVESFQRYIAYKVLKFCVENDRSVSSVARSCGLATGYFDELLRPRDMTIDVAGKILEYVGVFEKGTDYYGSIFEAYDKFVFGKKDRLDLPFKKETIRYSQIKGTSLRISSVLGFTSWLGVDFESFFLYF